jgi:hypothetical protein
MFALLNTHKLSRFLWYATFTLFVLFVGFRFEVGPDWMQYGYIHSSLAYQSFWDVIAQAEPLSYVLFWASEQMGYHIYFSNLVAAVIMLTGVFAFARRTVNPWLAVVSATPYFIIVMGMSGVRQTMAAGIILFLFSRWERYSFIKRGIFILIAAMFHTSALVNNVFLVIKLNIAMRYKLALAVLITIATLYISLGVSVYSDNIMQYQQRYLESDVIDESFGSIYHIAMIAVPAMLGFIYKRRIFPSIHSASLMNFGLYASVVIFFLNFFSSTVASRLTVYLYFVPMMVYPALVATYGRRGQMASMFAVIIFHMLILLAWFTFGNHAFAYNDYKNIIFE